MSKRAETRDRILNHAVRVASVEGLAGLTVAKLASELGLSKSGLFAHFGSKDALEVSVLATASERFLEIVVRPAFRAPRGEPRVQSLFEHWLKWVEPPNMPGGCIFVAASAELDDRPGPARDFLLQMQQEWIVTLDRVAQGAVEVGDFREDLDTGVFAFEFYAMMLGYNLYTRLLRVPTAEAVIGAAFERLLLASRCG